MDTLARLDPGRPVVIDAPPLPAEPSLALAEAARPGRPRRRRHPLRRRRSAPVGAAQVAPFVLLAKEFAGDLSFDPYSSPTRRRRAGPSAAWSFVRGNDLGLRVIARTPAGDGRRVPSTSWR